MNSAATSASEPAAFERPVRNPWLVACAVSLATFMEVLDITVATVALRHIAGALSASIDESAWILTSYLVANAIVLPISGWLATVLGRKAYYLLSVAAFTASSLCCGLSWSLESLIFFRVLQGLSGGGLASTAQSILAASFPPEKRGQAFAVFGVTVVVAPILGPVLGGWITDHYSWHWVFFINAPMGILALILVSMFVVEPAPGKAQWSKLLQGGLKVDYIGFVLVALGLGCLEITLDQGQRNDWFSSNFIIAFAVMAAAGLTGLVIWEWRRDDPIVDIRLLVQRQFGSCILVMLIIGGILIGTTQLVPQLLQTEFGYTATLAGLALSPGGIISFVLMPVAGMLTGKVHPRYLVSSGLAALAFAMWVSTGLNGDITLYDAAWLRILLSLGLPFVFLPLAAASYAGLPPEKTNQASALFNVARNLGGSIGVALSQTLLQQREQFHQARLVEHAIPSNPAFQNTLSQVTGYFAAHGAAPVLAAKQAMGWIAEIIARQSAILAFIDVSWMFMIAALFAIPIAFTLRAAEAGATPAGH